MINVYVKWKEEGKECWILAMRTANDLIAQEKINKLKAEGNHKVKVLKNKPFIPVLRS